MSVFGFSAAMKKQAARLAIGLAAVASIGTSVVGCDSDDLGLIGGTIAVVAGVHAIDHAVGHDRRCHGGYRTVCRSTTDRWGRVHRDCDREWDSCASYYSTGFALSADSSLAGSLSTPIDSAQTLVAKYSLPTDAAERLAGILQSAARGDTTTFAALGFSNDDLKAVARYRMPSETALEQVGSTLAISRDAARSLISQLMEDTRVQMADLGSAAWTACMATGKWKTNANGGTCKSLAWSGCSPASGASICASVK